MSLILNALKRVQQIGWERQQREQRFGTRLPWLSRWNNKWITRQKLLLLLGLTIAMALFFTLYRAGVNKPPEPFPQSSSGHMVTYPINHGSLEELQGELIEVPFEEVALISSLTPSFVPVPYREKTQKRVSVTTPKSPHPAAKPVEPIHKKPSKQPVEIRSIPSREAIKHFNLGLLYHKNNKLYEALKEYKKALEIDPLNVQAHNNIGMVYKDLGKLAEAGRHYQKALSINPTYEKAYHNLAVVYYLKGDFEKAVMEYKLAIDCNPGNPETYNNMGLIYRKQKENYRAKNIFHKGLSIAPDYAPLHYNLALVLEDDGDWKNAVSHYRKFVELSPDHRQELVEKVKRRLKVLAAYEKQ